MGQVQIYSLGKRRVVHPPAESHPRPNQSPAWKMSTFWHPLAGRRCWEWSEIIHYLRASFVTFPLKVATMQSGSTFDFLIIIVTGQMYHSVFSNLCVPGSVWRPLRSVICVLPLSVSCAVLGCCQVSLSGAWHAENVKHHRWFSAFSDKLWGCYQEITSWIELNCQFIISYFDNR